MSASVHDTPAGQSAVLSLNSPTDWFVRGEVRIKSIVLYLEEDGQ